MESALPAFVGCLVALLVVRIASALWEFLSSRFRPGSVRIVPYHDPSAPRPALARFGRLVSDAHGAVWTGEDDPYTLPTDADPHAKPRDVIRAYEDREAWRAETRRERGFAVNYPVVED